jgi:hypothetical protein
VLLVCLFPRIIWLPESLFTFSLSSKLKIKMTMWQTAWGLFSKMHYMLCSRIYVICLIWFLFLLYFFDLANQVLCDDSVYLGVPLCHTRI